MPGSSKTRSPRISPKFRAQDWLNLGLDHNPTEPGWQKAIDILQDRINGRFLEPAKELIAAQANKKLPTFGFAILALDFLVIETVEGFREGLPNHNGHSKRLFLSFLPKWVEFQSCVPKGSNLTDRARELYERGRCALHHSGTTDKLEVGISGNMLEFRADGSIRVNRNEFHRCLEEEFKRYISDLRNPASGQLRANLKSKLDAICQN
ncbi:hypothetical protein HJA90_09605 [Rhizobium bangladeshense]|uniref:hypothetical protein n=1 Tax=Rhizobium bangladeshense TaxID=1138189 RepID=UPI001C828294|nr:hypothetical protein [Rhizobium bangladeshense]MBX4883843.1 hypothetical protein [Rhizobium bangladeshense]